MSAPQLPDRCTIADVHAAMAPGLPDHTEAAGAPFPGMAVTDRTDPQAAGPSVMDLPPVPAAGSKHTGPPDARRGSAIGADCPGRDAAR